MGLLFLKLLLYLRGSAIVGPFLNVIIRMLWDILVFFCLFLFVIMIFIVIGKSLFFEISEFSSAYNTTKTLLAAFFGDFSFGLVNSD